MLTPSTLMSLLPLTRYNIHIAHTNLIVSLTATWLFTDPPMATHPGVSLAYVIGMTIRLQFN